MFKAIVSGMKVRSKSYIVQNHAKKIHRSLPAKWRPSVMSFRKQKT